MARVDAAVGGDRWAGAFEVDMPGRWQWRAEAYTDRFATWCDELQRKLAAGETELESELAEGAAILEDAARAGARGDDATRIRKGIERISDGRRGVEERCRAALEPALAQALAAQPDRGDAARSPVVRA